MRKMVGGILNGNAVDFLIDMMEDRWYVWGKLNNYDK